MDLFKAQLERIQKQLSVLTPSQKMLTAAMVAIMVMTLVWWGRTAGEPEMEALLPQSISPDELPRVEAELDAKHINHVMQGDKLLVPADRKMEALSSLMYSHALPRNAKDGFDDVLKNVNPFLSDSQQSKMWNRGKEVTVAQIIADFPDVADAHVMIDPTRVVQIGGGVDPSATVTITMRSGITAPQKLVDAAADVVQGAQSNLPRSKIKVVINGIPRRVKPDDGAGAVGFADDQQEVIQHEELRLEDKIKSQLSYIPGLMVAVTVKLNTTRVESEAVTYDPKNTVSNPSQEHRKTQETTGPASSGGEPGTGANTSLSVNGGAPAAAGGTSTSIDDSTTTYQNMVGTEKKHSVVMAGDTTPIAAAVRVPLAYFAAIYQRENPTVKDPTEKQMRTLIDAEIPKIRHDVKVCAAGVKSDEDIAVETYVDPTPITVATQTATAGISMSLLNGGIVKEVVLGVLALVSLFMVSMVVKKGTPAPSVAVAASGKSPSSPVLNDGNDELAGTVGEGATALDGMELDDDAVRTQQMLDQVSSLVKENPDSAALLVKRWLNRA